MIKTILLSMSTALAFTATSAQACPDSGYLHISGKDSTASAWDHAVRLRYNGVVGNSYDTSFAVSFSSNASAMDGSFDVRSNGARNIHVHVIDKNVCPGQEVTFDCVVMLDNEVVNCQLSSF